MKSIYLVMLVLFSSFLQAEYVFDTKIEKIYAQSKNGSSAHLVKFEKPIDDSCETNRVYIEFEDNEIFSLLVARHIANQSVDISYMTNQPAKSAVGHTAGNTCKLVSVF